MKGWCWPRSSPQLPLHRRVCPEASALTPLCPAQESLRLEMLGASRKGLGKAGGSGVGPPGVVSWRGLFQLDDSRQALPASEPQLPLLKRRKTDTHLPGRRGAQVGMGAPWHLEGAQRTGWHRAWWQVASLCGASVSLSVRWNFAGCGKQSGPFCFRCLCSLPDSKRSGVGSAPQHHPRNRASWHAVGGP